MRGQGRVFRPKWEGTREQAVWWLDYSVRGKRFRESSHTTKKSEALRMLRQRTGAREDGKLIGNPDHVKLATLQELVERQYALDGRRSLARVKLCWKHLADFFGSDAKALEVDAVRIDSYAERRLADGAARATVNQELAALRRGFRLAVRKGVLASRPEFSLPEVNNTRKGFFDESDFTLLMAELADHVRAPVLFARATGWRLRKEVLPLTWDAVDWDDADYPERHDRPVVGSNACIRLEGMNTKSGEPRVFPFAQASELVELLLRQWDRRDGQYVFHRDGKRVKSIRTAWDAACRRANLEGRLIHDLRRTAARDMRRAGLSESDIMDLCGWETREMLKRYCIKDERALGAAVAKRFAERSGKRAASGEAPAAYPTDVSSSLATTTR